MNKNRRCKNCGDEYKVHIDYTFTEYSEADWDDSLIDRLTAALSDVKCTNYKPMSNLEYLEFEEERRRKETPVKKDFE